MDGLGHVCFPLSDATGIPVHRCGGGSGQPLFCGPDNCSGEPELMKSFHSLKNKWLWKFGTRIENQAEFGFDLNIYNSVAAHRLKRGPEKGPFGVLLRRLIMKNAEYSVFTILPMNPMRQKACNYALLPCSTVDRRAAELPVKTTGLSGWKRYGPFSEVFTAPVLNRLGEETWLSDNVRCSAKARHTQVSYARPCMFITSRAQCNPHKGSLPTRMSCVSFRAVGAIFQTKLRREVISYAVTRARLERTRLKRPGEGHVHLSGAYSMVIMSPRKALAPGPQRLQAAVVWESGDPVIFASELRSQQHRANLSGY